MDKPGLLEYSCGISIIHVIYTIDIRYRKIWMEAYDGGSILLESCIRFA
jgi:hypothetical protein